MTRSFLRKIYSRREINIILGKQGDIHLVALRSVCRWNGKKRGRRGLESDFMGVELGLEEYRFRIGRLALLPPFFFFCWWNFIFGFRYSFCKRLMEHGRWNILFRNRIFACYCKRRLNGIFREKYERFSSAVRMTSSDEIAWFPIGHSIVRN